MADLLRVVVILVAVANPARAAVAARPRDCGARLLTVHVGIAAVVVALLTWLVAAASGPILDFLDISPESFRVGAGIVIAVGGIRAATVRPAVWDDLEPRWYTFALPLAFPVLLAPELVAAGLSLGADDGAGPVLAGAAVGLALCVLGHAVVHGRPGRTTGGVGRFSARPPSSSAPPSSSTASSPSDETVHGRARRPAAEPQAGGRGTKGGVTTAAGISRPRMSTSTAAPGSMAGSSRASAMP